MAMQTAIPAARWDSNQSKTRIATVLLLLLFVQDADALGSIRSHVRDLPKLPRRGLRSSEVQPRTLAVDLMHVLHVDSPYAQPNLTLSQRFQLLVARSKQRTSYFSLTTSEKEAVFSSPLHANANSYIMEVTLGTPARTFSAVADTGSDLVWVQCDPSVSCFKQPDSPFQPNASSSFNPISCTDALCDDLGGTWHSCSSSQECQYTYHYGDGSFTNGSLAHESFTFTSADQSTSVLPNIGFGCGMVNEALFANADGLVGLGRGPLSLVSQLGPNIDRIFSYCLLQISAATNKTSSLLFGSAGNVTLEYTPLVPNSFRPSFYYVNLNSILVNDQLVPIPAGTFEIDSTGQGGFIIDSGTTITVMVNAGYTPLKNAVSALMHYPAANSSNIGFDLCYNMSTVANPEYPTLVFMLDNVNITLLVHNSFVEVDNEGTICLAFLSSGNPGTISIFGNLQQQDYQIAFDLAANRVGFAPNTC